MYETIYHRPSSVDEAAALFAKGADAKYLSGGHTLIPVMKQRLPAPSDLIDLGPITETVAIELSARPLTINAAPTYSNMRHPASRRALTGVFAVKTKAGDVRVAATGASQNGVMRAPAIEAALKANWSASALDGLTISADGLIADIHGSSAYRANLIK